MYQRTVGFPVDAVILLAFTLPLYLFFALCYLINPKPNMPWGEVLIVATIPWCLFPFYWKYFADIFLKSTEIFEGEVI